jgi:MFS transporter, UMF1 family
MGYSWQSMKSNKKAIWGWALYDWANSAFATTVMAGFFPIFFKDFWSIGVNTNISTARLGVANAAASLFVAILAPVLGAIADQGGTRKNFLISFAYLGVLMTAALFWVGKGQWALAVFIYAAGSIGFAGANVFYDALLPDVAEEKHMDRISSLGYSLGYLGGGLLFSVNVLMVLMFQKFGFSDKSEAVRVSFLSVALWWGAFTLFTIFWVPKERELNKQASKKHIIFNGLSQLVTTFQNIRQLKTVMLFLLAYWFYIDGVDTIIRMAVDFGLSLGFESNDLIKALLIVQFVGFPAALAFGFLGEKWGTRKAIFLSLGVYIFITAYGVQMTRKEEFYVLAIMIGLVQGGIQALSRSYYARLIPKGQAAQFFGFYNLLGKFSAILGPVLIGATGLLARRILLPPSPTAAQLEQTSRLASRWSLGAVVVLFVIGGIIFFFVKDEKGKKERDKDF